MILKGIFVEFDVEIVLEDFGLDPSQIFHVEVVLGTAMRILGRHGIQTSSSFVKI